MWWWFVVSLGLSFVASLLLKPKSKSLNDDQKSPLATRGTPLAYVAGRRRVSAKFAWVGDRSVFSEKVSSGPLGIGSVKQKIYKEGGYTPFALGPATRLWNLRWGGKVIMPGPIDRDSHPSGTEVDLGKEGTFRIYWGEHDQPVDSYLLLRTRLSTRLPFHCGLVWDKKRLGTSPQWQEIEADLLVPIQNPRLTAAPAEIEVAEANDADPTIITQQYGDLYYIVAIQSGSPGVGYFEVKADPAGIFLTPDLRTVLLPGQLLRIPQTPGISGLPPQTTDWEVLRVEFLGGAIHAGGVIVGPNSCRIFLRQGLFGISLVPPIGNAWVVQNRYVDAGYGSTPTPAGVNPIHLVHQILFDPFPYGLGFDRDQYDLASFEAACALCDRERLAANVLSDGEEAIELLAKILQDVGFALALDVSSGLYRLRELREPESTPPTIGADAVLPDLPEIESSHDELAADRLLFKFADEDNEYRDMPISIGDDGQASYLEHAKRRSVAIHVATHFKVAGQIAERRSQEELASGALLKISAGREARLLLPGQPFYVDGVPGRLRAMTVRIDPSSSRVDVEAPQDFIAAPLAQKLQRPGYTPPATPLYPEADPLFDLFEVPAYLSPGQVTVAAPRARAHDQVDSARVWISREDDNYSHVADDVYPRPAARLVATLPATSRMVLDPGPQVTVLGPDADAAQDLSGDLPAWLRGAQLAILVDANGRQEVCYLRQLVHVSGSTYRMDGLVRARYASERRDFFPGSTKVFVVDPLAIPLVQDALLAPLQPLFLKTQPLTALGEYGLDLVLPVSRVLRGEGVVPMRPCALRTSNRSSSYRAGQSVTLRWCYRSKLVPKTGAGLQPAGSATSPSLVEGTFTLRLKTTGGVVKKTVSGLTSPTYVYPNATLVADFGSEVSFVAEVENALGQYVSDKVSITVQKVA